MKHLKKLTIVMALVMLFSMVLTTNVFAEGHDDTTTESTTDVTEYVVSINKTKDDPETEINELNVIKELVTIYGDHPATTLTFVKTEKCTNQLDVTVGDNVVSVYTSEVLVPNGSKIILGKDGNFYYYYDEETGIYKHKCTFEYKGKTITGYFAQPVDATILEEKSISTKDDSLEAEVEMKSLQDVIDCLIELESDITILMVGLIVVSVFACVAICFCIITRYKYLTLRDTVQELIEKKKPNNVSHNAHSKKKKHKR